MRSWVAHPSGARVTAVSDRSPGSPIVETWSTTDGSLLSSITLDIPTKFDVDSGSARISEDGAELYFVTRNDDGDVNPSLVRMPSVLRDASLRVDVPKRLTYGDRYSVTVHLDAELPIEERTVKLFAVRSGDRRLVATFEVGDDGLASREFTAKRNLRLTAEWKGDETHLAQRGRATVGVRARLFGRLRGARGTQGDYKLFRRGDVVGYVLGIVPTQDDYVKIRIFKKKPGKWAFLDQAAFKFGKDGVIGVGILGLPRGRYRLDGVFENKDYVGSHSNWPYFKVIGTGRSTAPSQARFIVER
jgi:hypothetical protein